MLSVTCQSDEESSDIVMELITGGDLLNYITSRPEQCLGK